MKGGKDKERYITICPKCNSTDVSGESNPAYVGAGLYFIFKQCNNCGHHGLVFPEVAESELPEETKKVERIKGRELVPTSYGRGYARTILPLSIVGYAALFVFAYAINGFNPEWTLVSALFIGAMLALYLSSFRQK